MGQIVQAYRELVELEKARRAQLYERMDADPEFALDQIMLAKADSLEYARNFAWVPDEHGDLGGGCVPFIVDPIHGEIIETLDWMVEEQEGFRRRRDVTVPKSRQVGCTAAVLIPVAKEWLFRGVAHQVLSSYEDSKIDSGGKGDRSSGSLFGKIRYHIDQLTSRLRCLEFNIEVRQNENRTPCGMLHTEDTTMKLTRPRLYLHKQEICPDGVGNLLIGDLPDDKMAKSITFLRAIMDEIGDYKNGADHKAYASCSPCCRAIFGFGTIPDDAREDCKLFMNSEEPAPSMRVIKAHWTKRRVYMDEAYIECAECRQRMNWSFEAPRDGEHVPAWCPNCEHQNAITNREIRSPWFDDACDAVNKDPVKIGRYYQMDWNASAGDTAFFTLNAKKAVCYRASLAGWKSADGYDPGMDRRNPACWVGALFDPATYTIRIFAYWMRHGVPIEWWLPFVMRWTWAQTQKVKVMSGAHTGDMWCDAHAYTQDEIELIERVSQFPGGMVYGDRYGDARHAGTESAYGIWRRYGATVRTKSSEPKKVLITKARDLYMPRLEIDPVCADVRPFNDGSFEPSIKTALTKVRMQSSDTSQSEAKPDFDKRTPKNCSHPADAVCAIVNHQPNRIEGRVGFGGEVVVLPAGGYDDEQDYTHGESLPGA